jgi:hypothetical protein
MKTVLASSARPWLATTLSIAIAALAFATPAHAQWKWRDAGGRVTISDTPPPAGIPEKDVLQRPTPQRRAGAPAPAASAASAPAATPVSALESEVEARKRKAEEEQKAKDKALEAENAAKRADNCARARAHLRALDDGLRIARVNDKGEREILDDKGRAAEAQRARAVIASDCK